MKQQKYDASVTRVTMNLEVDVINSYMDMTED
jgi:hypothetical protein